MLENLRQNKLLIEKGKKYSLYYFLIESTDKINSEIKIGNIAYLYNLTCIDYESTNENGQLINEIKKIWQYENNFNIQTKSYILVIKIVKLT